MKKSAAVIALVLIMIVIMATTTFKTEDVFCGVPQRSVSVPGPGAPNSLTNITYERDTTNKR